MAAVTISYDGRSSVMKHLIEAMLAAGANMKKVLSILMVAFAMTAMIACGDNNEGSGNGGGNNGGNTGGGDTPSHLSGLKYHRLKNNGDGMTEHTITFGNGYDVEYHVVWNWPGANEDGSDWVGDET